MHVGAGEDSHHAGRRLGLDRVDAGDLGMGVGASEDVGVGLTRAVDVVGVVALAGEKAEIFLAPHRGADPLVTHHTVLPFAMASAPALMAFTML